MLAGLVAAGCGEEQQHDNTAKFVSCLQERGGERVTARAQLDDFPERGLDWGIGAALDSISYETIEAQETLLVFVEDPRAPVGHSPRPTAGKMLAQARQGTFDARALVLMSSEDAVADCEEVAAPGEAVP